jgi:UDP-N-acetyl-D-glucosamine dehydrogenase
MTPACLEVATLLYRQIIDHVVPVSSTETAEMAKLWENTFRAVNVALANELALISRKVGVDPFEVVRAAATKPFGFMPFFPGPGLGGHCVPVDPLYLSWRSRSLDCPARFIELADAVNGSMPHHVVQRLSDALNEHRKPLSGSHVLVYGVTYKRDVSDVRESPAIPILHGLVERGATVAYSDPFVPHLETELISLTSVPRDASFSGYDAVVVVTDHTELERERLLAEARLVLDTRDALGQTAGPRGKIQSL